MRSKYPLIVAVTLSLPKEAVNALVGLGLDVKVVESLRPKTKTPVVAHRFEDTWTKLVVFGFEGFQVNISTRLFSGGGGQANGRRLENSFARRGYDGDAEHGRNFRS